MRSPLRAVALAGLVGLIAGCGKNVVNGRVTMDGRPLAGAQVELVPKSEGNLRPHAAATDADGKFTFGGSGDTSVDPGQYVVTVSKRDPKAGGGGMETGSVVPDVYTDRARTPLKAEVVSGTNELTAFDLNSKAAGNIGDRNKGMGGGMR